jgi:hypothetical protein
MPACSRCSYLNDNDARFCGHCGAELRVVNGAKRSRTVAGFAQSPSHARPTIRSLKADAPAPAPAAPAPAAPAPAAPAPAAPAKPPSESKNQTLQRAPAASVSSSRLSRVTTGTTRQRQAWRAGGGIATGGEISVPESSNESISAWESRAVEVDEVALAKTESGGLPILGQQAADLPPTQAVDDLRLAVAERPARKTEQDWAEDAPTRELGMGGNPLLMDAPKASEPPLELSFSPDVGPSSDSAAEISRVGDLGGGPGPRGGDLEGGPSPRAGDLWDAFDSDPSERVGATSRWLRMMMLFSGIAGIAMFLRRGSSSQSFAWAFTVSRARVRFLLLHACNLVAGGAILLFAALLRVPVVARACLAIASGLLALCLPLAAGATWQKLALLVGLLVTPAGLVLRARRRASIAPRLLTTAGVLVLLSVILVPQNGIVPLFAVFDGGAGKTLFSLLTKLGPPYLLLVCVCALLVWLPARSSAGGAVWAVLLLFYWPVEQLASSKHLLADIYLSSWLFASATICALSLAWFLGADPKGARRVPNADLARRDYRGNR